LNRFVGSCERSSDPRIRGGGSRISRLGNTVLFVVDIVFFDIISPSTPFRAESSWCGRCSTLSLGDDAMGAAPLVYLRRSQDALGDRTRDLIARREEVQAVFRFHVRGGVAPRVLDQLVDRRGCPFANLDQPIELVVLNVVVRQAFVVVGVRAGALCHVDIVAGSDVLVPVKDGDKVRAQARVLALGPALVVYCRAIDVDAILDHCEKVIAFEGVCRPWELGGPKLAVEGLLSVEDKVARLFGVPPCVDLLNTFA
jgi:hypothetical protein